MDEVRQLVGQNRKIEAIKRYRELHGCSLADAKNAIDTMDIEEISVNLIPDMQQPQIQHDTQSPMISAHSGWRFTGRLAVLLISGACLAGIVYLLITKII